MTENKKQTKKMTTKNTTKSNSKTSKTASSSSNSNKNKNKSLQPKSYNLLDKGIQTLPRPSLSKEFQQCIAEFIGTAILTFAVTLNLGQGEPILHTALIASLTVGVFVYIFGSVSGTHLNPAVTLGLLATRKISYRTAMMYIPSQIIGAMFAILLINKSNLEFLIPQSHTLNWQIFSLEALGTAILLLGVMSVVTGKVKSQASGLTIGGSLLLGILLTANATLGILNPAIAISWNIIDLSYIAGPIVGAVLATITYKLLIITPVDGRN